MNVFDNFSKISGLNPNNSKCEIVEIGDLKGVRVALCGMHASAQTKKLLKIWEYTFFTIKSLKKKKKINNQIAKIENVLRVWRMTDLTIEGKIAIFKSLAISKFVHLALINTAPTFTAEQLNIIKKNFIWQEKKQK